jgi:hypothetical protein
MFIREGIDNFWILNWLDEFMIGHKGFICGGCFKNIFNKEKVKDLDIFFEKESDFDEAVEYFDSRTLGYEGNDKQEEEYTFYYENEKVKAYKHIRTGTVIELCSNIYGKPEEILSRFDFTVTKFAYYKAEIEDETGEEYVSEVDPFEKVADTHIEYRVIYADRFFEHLHMKRLVTDDKIPYPMSTFERMLRYAKYGYFPCRETKMKIIEAIRELDERQVELSENLYDGID